MDIDRKCPVCGTIQTSMSCWRCWKIEGRTEPTVETTNDDYGISVSLPKEQLTEFLCIYCGSYKDTKARCSDCEEVS